MYPSEDVYDARRKNAKPDVPPRSGCCSPEAASLSILPAPPNCPLLHDQMKHKFGAIYHVPLESKYDMHHKALSEPVRYPKYHLTSASTCARTVRRRRDGQWKLRWPFWKLAVGMLVFCLISAVSSRPCTTAISLQSACFNATVSRTSPGFDTNVMFRKTATHSCVSFRYRQQLWAGMESAGEMQPRPRSS